MRVGVVNALVLMAVGALWAASGTQREHPVIAPMISGVARDSVGMSNRPSTPANTNVFTLGLDTLTNPSEPGIDWVKDDQFKTDWLLSDYNLLFGGIDSNSVVDRLTDANGVMAGVARRMVTSGIVPEV